MKYRRIVFVAGFLDLNWIYNDDYISKLFSGDNLKTHTDSELKVETPL